jgi:hypothetical protein
MTQSIHFEEKHKFKKYTVFQFYKPVIRKELEENRDANEYKFHGNKSISALYSDSDETKKESS